MTFAGGRGKSVASGGVVPAAGATFRRALAGAGCGTDHGGAFAAWRVTLAANDALADLGALLRGSGEAGLAAYSCGRFCKALAKATEGTGRLEMRFPYAPGNWMFSDFSGKSVPVLGPGGARYPEIIVVVLAYSNLLYVEALEAQSGKHWTMAQRRALEYFGGCSRCLGIDNLKAGVTRNQGEDILLNPSFREFSLHYSIAALPARVGKPTEKGVVEGSVGTVNRRILAPLLGRRFFSVEELNAALRHEPEGVVRGTGARRASSSE